MLGVVAALVAATVAPGPSAAATTAPSSTVWLCRPGLANDPCDTSLTTTVVGANGARTVRHARPAADPPIDCFYVHQQSLAYQHQHRHQPRH